MKYSIVVKFLAIALCAAMLLIACGAGFGIFAMTESGLYQRSWEAAYANQRNDILQNAADNIAIHYAARELGGLSRTMADAYLGGSWYLTQFQSDSMRYTLLDPEGNVLEQWGNTGTDAYSLAKFTVNALTYPVLLEVRPQVQITDPTESSQPAAEIQLPTTISSDMPMQIYGMPDRNTEPVGVLEAGQEVEILKIENVAGEDWALCAEGWLPVIEMINMLEEPEETEAPETPRPLNPDAQYLHYFDPETRQDMVLGYRTAQMPGYTVQFRLTDTALPMDAGWLLLGVVARYQQYLLPALVGSLFLFAVLAVYLCCAAGRKPGSQEIRPGGLNRIPLDCYLILVCCAVVVLSFFFVEGIPELMDGSLTVTLAYGAGLGYLGALLLVGFCFACAAQFKTPGGCWWRGSLCGLVYRACVFCLSWGLRFCLFFWQWFSRFCRVAWQWFTGSVLPWSRDCFLSVWKIIRAVLGILWQWCLSCLRIVKKSFLNFVRMLPMTWQWLLAGFCIIIALALTVNTRFGFWGILASIALVLYGAHAFGILLGGVKRMVKGDLDEKVDDKLLIGSFKDFSDELNGLADVVVESARKQLRSERMKTELITNVSHDIKTPLTSIINYVDLLEKPHTEQEQAQYLEVLSRQSQRLKKLIEDLMELSKASTGNMAVEIQTMDGAEVVNQALGEFADKLEKARLIPVFRQPEEPVRMLADGRMVWRVMSNLLGNAVKYALPGTRIYLDLNRVGDQVILSVKNISREELNVEAEELMERFVRGDASRNTEGSGLGLNIARSLMELQKGSLQLLVDGDLFKVTLIFPAAES